MDTLFQLPEQLSPRLAWMERHNLTTFRDDTAPADMGPWFAGFKDDLMAMGSGRTEEEALIDFARFEGFLSWTEEAAKATQPAS